MTGYVCQFLWKECGKHCPNLLNPVYARNMSSKFFMKKKNLLSKNWVLYIQNWSVFYTNCDCLSQIKKVELESYIQQNSPDTFV